MVVRPERVIIKFADELIGSKAAFAVTGLQRVANGRDIEVPMWDIDAAELAQLANGFNLAATTQIETLTNENQSLQSELDAKTAEVASLTAQIATLTEQLDALLNPPGPDVTTREGLKAYLAQKRYEKEIAGFTVGGQLISTNRDELAHWFARFFDAFNHLNGVPSASGGVYPYKPRGGTTVVNLTAAQAVRAYQCLAWYVNACIATEGQLIAMVDDAPLSQLVDIKEVIDTESTWPQRTFDWVPS